LDNECDQGPTQELTQMIGELYAKLHRAQFVIIPQLQNTLHNKDVLIAEYEVKVRTLEVELEKHRTTIQEFMVVQGKNTLVTEDKDVGGQE